MATIDIARGSAGNRNRQLVDRNGNTFGASNTSPFLSSDTISATVSIGEDFGTLFAPTAVWLDATGIASYQLIFTSANTAGRELATYYGQTSVQRGSADPGVVDNWRLKITRSPGTETVPVCFTTYDDLQLYYPAISNLQTETDDAGFLAQQSRATTWLINTLVMAFKPKAYSFPPSVPGQNWYNPFFWNTSQPSQWYRQQLIPLITNSTVPAWMTMRPDSGANFYRPAISTKLLLTDDVIECVAHVALGYVFRAQIGRNTTLPWHDLAKEHFKAASAQYKAITFETDLANPQVGWGGICIVGGTTDLR